ncbi:unnamed protein product [Moneuplotes crassus]|uniref:RING-type domain-containing protein n=1 Tax=Euplotes crassus TaxID=5936 RepID=A0AAD1UHG7_EUPCR|nr:unnamed protein product [Moneuplotes crassus]
MAVPTGGINRYGILEIQEKDLFTLIKEEAQGFDPMLLFLLGYNYCKLEGNYNGKSFFELAKIIQKSIKGNLLNKVELQATYRKLYGQDYLSDVLNLSWFKRHKEAFEQNNEEVSLMKRNPKREQEECKDDSLSVADASSPTKSPNGLLVKEEEKTDLISSFLKSDISSDLKSEDKRNSSETYHQLIEHQQRLETERKLKEEEENKKLIDQMLAEEKLHQEEAQQRAAEEEQESIRVAQEIQKKFEEESKQRREAEEEKNKPECKICYDVIEFDDINVIGCGHIYHPYCMKMHLQAKTDSKAFPLSCPEPQCGMELAESEIQSFCDDELYDKITKFQLELFLEQNNEMFNHCPTPDCEFVFEWDGDKENQQFKCSICHKNYCIMCRVEWHDGLNCQEYRELNGYPPEDRAFYKFIKGAQFKQCPQCKYWVEKSSGCDHMTCRCRYEFCYRCGGKYQACDC